MNISFRAETCASEETREQSFGQHRSFQWLRVRVAAHSGGVVFGLAIATALSAQPSSTPIQLPASGRGLQPGSVGTTQSTVNAGGQNSVNLIDSSVSIQGSYLGSVPTGIATDAVISLSLQEALRRGLDYNLGAVSVTEGVRQARAQRLAFLSQLLPEINGNLQETVEQTN